MQKPARQDYDFLATIRMRDKLIGWAIIFTPLLAMLLLLKLCYRPEPIEPRYVYGCYASNVARAYLSMQDQFHSIILCSIQQVMK